MSLLDVGGGFDGSEAQLDKVLYSAVHYYKIVFCISPEFLVLFLCAGQPDAETHAGHVFSSLDRLDDHR